MMPMAARCSTASSELACELLCAGVEVTCEQTNTRYSGKLGGIGNRGVVVDEPTSIQRGRSTPPGARTRHGYLRQSRCRGRLRRGSRLNVTAEIGLAVRLHCSRCEHDPSKQLPLLPRLGHRAVADRGYAGAPLRGRPPAGGPGDGSSSAVKGNGRHHRASFRAWFHARTGRGSDARVPPARSRLPRRQRPRFSDSVASSFQLPAFGFQPSSFRASGSPAVILLCHEPACRAGRR
jgi:hypothetical protein